MKMDDLNEVTQKMKIGDRLIFKYQFQKWKGEENLTIPGQQYLKPKCISSNTSDEMDALPSVREILNQHKIGCSIIEHYQQLQILTEKQRNMLLNIIVDYFYAKNITMTLQISYGLEKQIIKLFPKEKLEFYRSERRGKLYIKYHNCKNKMKFSEVDLPSSCNTLDKPAQLGNTDSNKKQYTHF